MATTSSFAHINQAIGLIAFCPELVQGTPNHSFTADGGANSGTAVTISTVSGASQNNNISAITAEKFQGLQVVFDAATTTSALRGKAYNISAQSAPASNVVTLTVDTMDATPATTDTFKVLGALPAEKAVPTTEIEDLKRDFHRLTLDAPSSVKGLSKASGSINMELPGLNTALGDSVSPVKDRFSVFLETFYGVRSAAVGTSVTGSGSTTSVIDVTDASNFNVDDIVIIGSDARRITAIDTVSVPDNITLNEALSAVPAAATVVYNTESFTPADTGHATGTIFFLTDDRLYEIRGCIGSIKVTGAVSDFAKVVFDFNGEWDPTLLTDAASLNGYQLNKDPIAIVTFRSSHFGSTSMAINSFEFDAGSASTEIRDGEAGMRYFIRSREAKLKVVHRYKNSTTKTTWAAQGTKNRILVCAGPGAGNMIGFEGWGQIKDNPSESEVNETGYWDATWSFFDDQDSNSATKPRIIRG